MAHDAAGGASGTLVDQLDTLFTEIVQLLGELAGNEAALRVIEEQESRELAEGWTREPGYFKFPGTYGFETQGLYVAMHPSNPHWDEDGVTNADRARLVQEAIDQVWEEARSSYTIGTLEPLYRSAARNIWEPDPAAMTSSVTNLQTVTQWLDGQTLSDAGWSSEGGDAPGWLGDLQRHWPATSRSSSTFYEFWADVDDKCRVYRDLAARLTVVCAQVTSTISSFQANLLEITELARDQVEEALKQWQAWKDDSGSWPTGRLIPNGDKAALEEASFYTGLASVWGPQAPIAGGISLVTGLAAWALPAKVREMEALDALRAADIHDGFYADLQSLEQNMRGVLDRVQSTRPRFDRDSPVDSDVYGRSFERFVTNALDGRANWRPLEVQL